MIVTVPAATRDVSIPLGGNLLLPATVSSPETPSGMVVITHGGGRAQLRPDSRMMALRLNDYGFATMSLDLLTAEEEEIDEVTADFRFDVEMLGARLGDVTKWVAGQDSWSTLGIGYEGTGIGAAAAMVAASRLPELVSAVVSIGGRPDLAYDALPWVQAPTLMILGKRDHDILEQTRFAASRMNCIRQLSIIPGSAQLFAEDGALDLAAESARRWFERHVFPNMRLRPLDIPRPFFDH